VIANFRRWTLRELDFRREAASASELADVMHAFPAIACRRSIGIVPMAG